jgi:hypothetical protein
MGNRIFKPKTAPEYETVEDDILSIISDHDTLLEPKEVVMVSASATITVDIPIIVAADIVESLSKSLPIDIPVPEPVVERKSESIEHSSIEHSSIEHSSIERSSIERSSIERSSIERSSIEHSNNNSDEITSLSSISEECGGFKSHPVTEESDLSSDEDIPELDE